MNPNLCRYGFYYPATLLKGERVAQALRHSRDFQWWDSAAVAGYQREQLHKLLRWAASASRFHAQRLPGMPQGRDELAKLPTMSKSDLIHRERDIRTPFPGRGELKTTGGSTGQPVRIHKNAAALAMERAVTWRSYEWAGLTVGDSQGRFWGVPHGRSGRLRAQLADLVGNRLRLSAFQLTEQDLQVYYGRLRRFRPRFLYGYVSVLEALARYLGDNGLPRLPDLKCVVTTSEVLYPPVRRALEAAFGVPVFNEYGCGEVGSIAHQCEQGNMHVMADNLLVEVDGAEGEILVTDLYNYKTPLIRYRVGDYGRLSERPCPCGRTLPVLENIYGRAYDLIQLRSGRAIHPESLIYVMEDFKREWNGVAQFQAEQKTLDRMDVYLVPRLPWNAQVAARLKQRLTRGLSGELEYHLHVVEQLKREKSGKMRVVKSAMAKENPVHAESPAAQS